jgi:hypothetical protein
VWPSRDARPAQRPPDEDPWAVAERKSRAVEEPLDVRLERSDPYPILEVRNPLHQTAYRVLLPLAPDRSVTLCTCPDYARRGLGTCKHIEAAVRWRERHPDGRPLQPARPFATQGLWEEIDRRVAVPPDERAPPSLAWRRAGAILYERAPPAWVETVTTEESKEGVRRGVARRSTRTSRGRP